VPATLPLTLFVRGLQIRMGSFKDDRIRTLAAGRCNGYANSRQLPKGLPGAAREQVVNPDSATGGWDAHLRSIGRGLTCP
jgi:hypothetical protein